MTRVDVHSLALEPNTFVWNPLLVILRFFEISVGSLPLKLIRSTRLLQTTLRESTTAYSSITAILRWFLREKGNTVWFMSL